MIIFRPIFIFLFSICFLFLSSLPAEAQKRQYLISGRTMGTFYTVKFISDKNQSEKFWKNKIDLRLKQINKRLSMYDPKSELSDFNRLPANEPVSISQDFYALLEKCQDLYSITKGAWDGTVKPLVDLWGFGTAKAPDEIPSEQAVARILDHTGFGHIQIKDRRHVVKTRNITLDLGSIAKGYGVDAVARLFVSSGIRDVLVEIGGELSASGKNLKNRPWRVGISRPDKKPSGQVPYKVVVLDHMAIATSGSYRNFIQLGKTTYSHIINPKTGFPVENDVVSASVIAKDCAFADGLATALMVMDIEKGIDLVNTLDSTECLVTQKKGDSLVHHMSEGFENFLTHP